jgi:uncharacterized membrane protein YciS (DUF1049 family)
LIELRVKLKNRVSVLFRTAFFRGDLLSSIFYMKNRLKCYIDKERIIKLMASVL